MKYELNVSENILDVREMTAEEIEADKANQAAALQELTAENAKAEAKTTARAAILDRLGLTADEAALLLS